MAEYVSTFYYELEYVDGTDEADTRSAGFYVVFGFPEDGTSEGGGVETFSDEDVITYTVQPCGCEDPPEPLIFEIEYVGYFESGWVGLLNCGCEPDPIWVHVLITNDDTLEFDQQIAVIEEPFTVCFLAGTAVACPGGDRPVEDLAVGDLVLTAEGDVRPVRFIGRQTYATLFADPLRTRPIRIVAGALGKGLPRRDLCVSPDHALLIDGLLVQAGALVNGTTVAPMTGLPERFTYFHIELDDHALILAEGVPAETFVDNVTRRRFDNYAEYEALYGESAPSIAEMALPRVKSARQVPRAVRQCLRTQEVNLACRRVSAGA